VKTRNYPPVPFVLVSKGHDKVPDDHDHHVDCHGRQPHFRLSDTSVLASGLHRDPIREKPIGGQADESSNEDSKVKEADRLTVEVVRRLRKGLTLRQIQRQETTGWPGHNKGCELDDGETQQLPRDPEADQNSLHVVSVQLPQLELLLWGFAAVQIRISLSNIFHIHSFLLSDLKPLLRLKLRCGIDVSFIRDFVWMNTTPLGLREEEYLGKQDSSKEANIQPEEAAPANVLCHGTSNNRADLMRVNDKWPLRRRHGHRHILPWGIQSRQWNTMCYRHRVHEETWYRRWSRVGRSSKKEKKSDHGPPDLRMQTDFSWTSTKSIENTSPHIAAVWSCERTPDVTDETNQSWKDQDWSSAVGSLNGDPIRHLD